MDDVRVPPVEGSLLAKINEQLDGIAERSAGAIIQVPVDGRLRGAVYVDLGSGLSFAGWLEHDLKEKRGMGYGVAIRKKW